MTVNANMNDYQIHQHVKDNNVYPNKTNVKYGTFGIIMTDPCHLHIHVSLLVAFLFDSICFICAYNDD